MKTKEEICKSKIAYSSRTEANDALKDFQSRPNCASVKVYYCEVCNNFHLSSHWESEARKRKIDRVVKRLNRKRNKLPVSEILHRDSRI